MAKFKIYSPAGTEIYEGTPSFTGQYMAPGLLEFREIESPIPLDLVAGCYVDYTRTGFRYRTYGVPQVKKQARQLSYGGAFIYKNVQLYDASKMLEFCPFRDLVKGDNRIHFSTQPSISTFEGVDGLARRFEACLQDQYGENSWRVRIATTDDGIAQDLADLMAEAREFTVSGVNILECLNKVYEIWPEVGWVYTVESSIDTIIIGGAGLNANQGTYAYGKGSGLATLTRTVANADEMANRIFAYGSSRNMLPRWYNNQTIKDRDSVDIQNLMIPISEWGLTDVDGGLLPDASKAFVEDAASIAKIGLRPATVYFDGSGGYPEIYPSIRNATIGEVRTWIQQHGSSQKWSPSTEIYPVMSERVDVLKSAQATFDSGMAGNDGKNTIFTEYQTVNASDSVTVGAGTRRYTQTIITQSVVFSASEAGTRNVSITLSMPGSLSLTGATSAVVRASLHKGHPANAPVLMREVELSAGDTAGTFNFSTIVLSGSKKDIEAATYYLVVDLDVVLEESAFDLTLTYDASGDLSVSLSQYRSKTFTVTLKQIGFDITEQASLGDGKTISMRSGSCVGRTFAINSVQYNSATDDWTLECFRSEDESLSQWFPNTDYPVRAGDEFVLLDIAMPELYIGIASQKLLQAAQELLSDTATERWQYVPEIDAKYMVENGRTIRAGEYMLLSDTAIVGGTPVSVLVDTVTINEGEAEIPTYKVTLRDRKRKTWTESESAPQPTSKSVGAISDATPQQSSSGAGDSFWTLDDNGNVTLKPRYENAWVPGWLAAGGIGSPGGGGGGLITSVKGISALGTPIATESLTETFSAKAIESIWEAVVALQNSTPNVSLTNRSTYYDLAVNGTTIPLYTKLQVDGLIGAINQFHYEIYASTSAVTSPSANVLYLIGPTGTGTDKYEEYVYANNAWTKIGDTTIDLSGYALASDIPTALSQLSADSTHRLVTDSQISAWNAKYDKPSGGIPKSDLASAVQTSLGKADTALQTFTETDPVYSEWVGASRTRNTVFAAPSSANGAPSFRALVASDIPSITISKISNAESWITGKGYALNSDLTTLAGRVTSIEDWFEIKTVNGQAALHVKQGRALYSDSWIASGGVGSGSGGGGTMVVWGTKSGYTRPLTVEGVTETLLLDGALAGYATTAAMNTALAGKQNAYGFTIQGESGVTYNLANFLTSHQSLADYALKAGGIDYNFKVDSLIVSDGGTLDGTTYNGKPVLRFAYRYTDESSMTPTIVSETKYLAYKDEIPTDYVKTSGAQQVSGVKTFLANIRGGSSASVNWQITTAGAATFASLTVGGNAVNPSNYVTLDGEQTITGAKTFSAQMTASGGIVTGNDIRPSANLGASLGNGDYRFSGLSVNTISSAAYYFRDSAWSSIAHYAGGFDDGLGYMCIYLDAAPSNQNPPQNPHYYFFGSGSFQGRGGTKNLGSSGVPWGDVYIANNKAIKSPDTGGTIRELLKLANNDWLYIGNNGITSVQLNATGYIKMYWGSGDAYASFGAGANAYFPNLLPNGNPGTKSLGSSSERWNNIYGVNEDLSGNLSLASASHIDIGPLRIEYDATNKALHITKKDSNDTETYGLYADGFVAAGGVQQNS